MASKHLALKMETVVLKVHVNCDGCQQRVKKILKKIEGVYAVYIDAEQQMAIVQGMVDSSTLIKKLARSGKSAEVWFPKTPQLELIPEPFSPDKNKNKNKNKNTNQLLYPNQQTGGGSIGNDWGIETNLNHDSDHGPDENDIGAMISMMDIHGHHDHAHGYGMGNRYHNYPLGLEGYGSGYQHQVEGLYPRNNLTASPALMNENVLAMQASQYTQNPYGIWYPQTRAVYNNNRFSDGYVQMFHSY